MLKKFPYSEFILLGNSIGAGIDLDVLVLFSKIARIKFRDLLPSRDNQESNSISKKDSS